MKAEDTRVFDRSVVSTGPGAAPLIDATGEDRHQEHFRTDHLLSNLKGRTVSSGLVTVTAQGAKFLLSIVSTMILARLLTPRDFGLVAMVTTVTGFMRVFKDAGLSIATVQREKITHEQVSNLFWINVGISILCSLIIAVAAPLIGRFYHNSRLIPIALLLSATFIVSGSTIQHQALLKRQMRFRALATIDVGSMLIGAVVGIVMAFLGYRYWSLVGSSLATEIISLLLTWSVSSWRPQLPTRGSGVGPLVSFGFHRAAGDFILSLARGTDNLLIGRFYGSAAVGLYSRASALLIAPLNQLLLPINAAFMPALCRLQSQPARYRSTFLRLYETIALATFVFTGVFLALARPITLVLLGPKWEQAAVIFAGFTVAALCVPLANAAAWLFTSQGRGREMLATQLINACAVVVSFVAGLPFGPVGVAMAFSVSNFFVRIPIYYFNAGRHGPVRTADLWRVILRHLPLWAAIFAVTSLTRMLIVNWAPLSQLLICLPIALFTAALLISSFSAQRRVAAQLFATIRELKKSPLLEST